MMDVNSDPCSRILPNDDKYYNIIFSLTNMDSGTFPYVDSKKKLFSIVLSFRNKHHDKAYDDFLTNLKRK